MFRPQPLHQLPKLPSHVLSEGASCLEPPRFNILGRRESYLSLACLPFTVCSSLPRPGRCLVILCGVMKVVLIFWGTVLNFSSPLPP